MNPPQEILGKIFVIDATESAEKSLLLPPCALLWYDLD
jgi:hypothetical protein